MLILPFIMLGVGVDGMFVLQTALDATDPSAPMEVRALLPLANALEVVGVDHRTQDLMLILVTIPHICSAYVVLHPHALVGETAAGLVACASVRMGQARFWPCLQCACSRGGYIFNDGVLATCCLGHVRLVLQTIAQ